VTKNNNNKEITVLTLVTLLALLALLFPFTNNGTGLVSAGQKYRTTQYPPLYEQQPQNTYDLVTTNDPCKAVQCSRPVADAHPVLDNYGKILTDEYGNVWCKCDGLAELYYRVSTVRKY